MKCFIIPVITKATRIITKGQKIISINNTREVFSRLFTSNSCTRDIVHNKEGATVWKLKIGRGVHKWFKRSTRVKETKKMMIV
jgi:hypothetical protein